MVLYVENLFLMRPRLTTDIREELATMKESAMRRTFTPYGFSSLGYGNRNLFLLPFYASYPGALYNVYSGNKEG
jgi:hypothetical protein